MRLMGFQVPLLMMMSMWPKAAGSVPWWMAGPGGSTAADLPRSGRKRQRGRPAARVHFTVIVKAGWPLCLPFPCLMIDDQHQFIELTLQAVEPDSTIRKLSFHEFWESLLRCALVAYSKISNTSVIDKIRGEQATRSVLLPARSFLVGGAPLANFSLCRKRRTRRLRSAPSPSPPLLLIPPLLFCFCALRRPVPVHVACHQQERAARIHRQAQRVHVRR